MGSQTGVGKQKECGMGSLVRYGLMLGGPSTLVNIASRCDVERKNNKLNDEQKYCKRTEAVQTFIFLTIS